MKKAQKKIHNPRKPKHSVRKNPVMIGKWYLFKIKNRFMPLQILRIYKDGFLVKFPFVKTEVPITIDLIEDYSGPFSSVEEVMTAYKFNDELISILDIRPKPMQWEIPKLKLNPKQKPKRYIKR